MAQSAKHHHSRSANNHHPSGAAAGLPAGSGNASGSSSRHSLGPNVVGVHYKVGKKIGEGSFGIIYEGVNLINNQPVAIKFEPRKSDAPQLRDEHRTYKILSPSVGIPSAYYFGQEGLHNVLVIDLLGPSLEDMFDLCDRKFSVKTVCIAAKQMITRVQTIHEKNLIYRDIKPDNFLIGRLPRSSERAAMADPHVQALSKGAGILASHSLQHPHPASQIYMVDFGMAKQYRDPKTKQHIPYREKKSLSGTARYMSINTHLGREQSRRDDLEALGHVFMYFLRGSLPWQGLKAATNKQKYEKIGEKKQTTSVKDLCDGFPDEFAEYLTYARELKFEEQPNYDHLRGLMDRVLQRMGAADDGVTDWLDVMDRQRRDRERQRENDREARERERGDRERQYWNYQGGAAGAATAAAAAHGPPGGPGGAAVAPHPAGVAAAVAGGAASGGPGGYAGGASAAHASPNAGALGGAAASTTTAAGSHANAGAALRGTTDVSLHALHSYTNGSMPHPLRQSVVAQPAPGHGASVGAGGSAGQDGFHLAAGAPVAGAALAPEQTPPSGATNGRDSKEAKAKDGRHRAKKRGGHSWWRRLFGCTSPAQED